MLDCAERCRGNPQPDRSYSVGEERNPLQVWQEAAFRLNVGMADIVPDLDALAGHHTFPCHTYLNGIVQTRRARPFKGRAPVFFLLLGPLLVKWCLDSEMGRAGRWAGRGVCTGLLEE